MENVHPGKPTARRCYVLRADDEKPESISNLENCKLLG